MLPLYAWAIAGVYLPSYAPGLGIWTTENEAVGSGFTANSRYTGDFGGT